MREPCCPFLARAAGPQLPPLPGLCLSDRCVLARGPRGHTCWPCGGWRQGLSPAWTEAGVRVLGAAGARRGRRGGSQARCWVKRESILGPAVAFLSGWAGLLYPWVWA